MSDEIIKIYADWSCLWNPWKWWYAAILMYKDNIKTIKWSEINTTNNRMELKAVIEALKVIKLKDMQVSIYIDSKYVYDWITNYINSWNNNNWLKSNNEPLKNVDLWKELVQLNISLKVSWNWIKWHSDNHLNNLVDKIAKQQALIQ